MQAINCIVTLIQVGRWLKIYGHQKMKNLFFILISIFIGTAVFSQTSIDEKGRDMAFYEATNKWFSAWKLVSEDLYHIHKVRPVEFIFFDDKYVYSTSTTTIKAGTNVKGCNLMNLSFKWKKVIHNDSILLPDKSILPISLMSFAAAIPGEKNKSFFVMPLPGYWEKSGTVSNELGLDNLVTGVFIHEFSHSQQMQNFGKSMTLFEKKNNFDVEFSDDIVQNIFSKDSSYTELYKVEAKSFFESVRNQIVDKVLVKDALRLMTQRQGEYFKGRFSSLKEIDKFFLTMEGLGQYSMYLWLTNPRGGNIEKNMAIKGVRRGGKWWSQDEGFALFLIVDKLSKPNSWASKMFGYKTENVVDLINKFL